MASGTIAVGYYDLTREIIARLRFDDSKVEFLTKLAKTQAQKELSPEEIAALSEADIQRILLGDNLPLEERIALAREELQIRW